MDRGFIISKSSKLLLVLFSVLVIALFIALTGTLQVAGMQPAAAAGAGYNWTDTLGLGDGSASALAFASSRNELYRATNHGVWCYDTVAGTWTDTGGSLAGYNTFSLGWDGSGLFAAALVIGTTPSRTWYYDPATSIWMDIGLPISYISTGSICLAWDGSGRMYAGTAKIDSYSSYITDGDGVWYCEVSSDPPTLTSATPDQAMQFTIWQDVQLEGTGFKYGAVARLEKDGTPVTEAFNLNVASDTCITCTLGLFGLAPGTYDLVVENPDSQVAIMEDGFTVTSACGSGSAATLLALGLILGLLSAGSIGFRRRRRK